MLDLCCCRAVIPPWPPRPGEIGVLRQKTPRCAAHEESARFGVARTVTRGGAVTTFEVSEGGQHDDRGHRAGAVVDALGDRGQWASCRAPEGRAAPRP